MSPRTTRVGVLATLGTILGLGVTALVVLGDEADLTPSPRNHRVAATGSGTSIDDERPSSNVVPTERRAAAEDLSSSTLARIAELATALEVDAASESALIEIARHDPSADCREAAVKALTRSVSDAVLDLWIDALRDPDEWVKDSAEMALFRFSERSRVCRRLELSMLDTDRAKRLAAASFADELITDRLAWNEIYAGPTEIHLPH